MNTSGYTNQSILQIIGYFVLSGSFLLDTGGIGNILAYGTWLVIWSIGIYDKIQRRRNTPSDAFLLTSQNDTYFRMSSLILGSLASAGAILWILVAEAFAPLSLALLSAGILILINGLLDFPRNYLTLPHQQLSASAYPKTLPIGEIEKIEIRYNSLRIAGKWGKEVVLERLAISSAHANEIKRFLSSEIEEELILIKV